MDNCVEEVGGEVNDATWIFGNEDLPGGRKMDRRGGTVASDMEIATNARQLRHEVSETRN